MPPKSKRQPSPHQHHLKHSRQLLEDYLYQLLPLLTNLGAISRINIFTWFSGKWGLTPDATAGLPYMLLDALRLQRQHLLQQKRNLKPFNLSLLGAPEDAVLAKALPLLQEINRQNPAASIKDSRLPWLEIVKQLKVQMQQQPPAERNLLLLDPVELPLPKLQELFSLLPQKLDVLLLIPAAAVLKAAKLDEIKPTSDAIEHLVMLLPTFYKTDNQAEEEEETGEAMQRLQQELRTTLAESNKRFGMLYTAKERLNPLLLYGFTADALMMEKMLLARKQLETREVLQLQTGKQIGLFGAAVLEAPDQSSETSAAIMKLFKSQPEWSNQDLYRALLQSELLPQDALKVIQDLIAGGQLEVLDEKRKKNKEASSLPINHTAYKLPAPSKFFRWKG